MTDSMFDFMKSDEIDEAQRIDFASRLKNKGQYAAAFEVWGSSRGISKARDNLMTNGDFETEINESERNFGWVVNSKITNTSLQVEKREGNSKNITLAVIFKGNSDPKSPVISQTIPIETGGRYQIRFSARSKDLVSGGMPVIAVFDPVKKTVVTKSVELLNDSWSQYVLDFNLPSETKAIDILLQRSGCPTGPCPVFGKIWLDDFKLSLLKSQNQGKN
jgi:hypothetical protein